MKIVRSGCFETNSSSCHSLSLDYRDNATIQKEIEKIKGKTIKVKLEGYYGGNFYLSTLEDKLSYIFSDLCPEDLTHELVDKDIPEDFNFGQYSVEQSIRLFDTFGTVVSESELRKYLNDKNVSDLIHWFEDLTGAKLEFVGGKAGWVGVDHDSKDLGRSLIEKGENKYRLKAFLFDARNNIYIEAC